MYQKLIVPALVSSGLLALSSVGVLAQPKSAARISGANVQFLLTGAPQTIKNIVVTVTGPNGQNATAYSKAGMPSVNMAESGAVSDGLYRYHITAATGEAVSVKSRLNNGRGDKARTTVSKSFSMSGVFSVKGGKIETKSDEKEE